MQSLGIVVGCTIMTFIAGFMEAVMYSDDQWSDWEHKHHIKKN